MEKEFFEKLKDLLEEYIGNSEEHDIAEEPEKIEENPEENEDNKVVVVKQEMPVDDAPDEIKKLIDFIRGGKAC